MNLLLFLQSLLAAPQEEPIPISFASNQRKYSVMPVRDWRAQDKMEKAAGRQTNTSKIMTDWFTCDLCRIGIGPNHCQQEVYLYPVYDQKAKLHGEGLGYVASDILHICGECATWKSRALPEWLCCIGPWAWETDRLVDYYQATSRREAAVIHLEVCEWLLIFVYCIAWNISLQACWQIILQAIEEVRIESGNLQIASTHPKKEKEALSAGKRMKIPSIFAHVEAPGFRFAH